MNTDKDDVLKHISNIMIVGCGGSGKSTLATQLGLVTGLRVIHMDHIYWQSGWVLRGQKEIDALVSKEIEQDGWICEGNNSASFYLRVPRTGLFIWLDFPRYICIWRVLLRTLKYYKKGRADLPEGCYDKFDWTFLKWVWNYNKTSRPKMEAYFNQDHRHLKKIILKSPAEVRRFMSSY